MSVVGKAIDRVFGRDQAGEDFIISADLDIEAAEDSGRVSIPVSIDAYNGGVLDTPNHGPLVIDLSGDGEVPPEVPFLTQHTNAINAQAGMGSPANEKTRLTAVGTIASETEAGADVLAGHRGGNKYQASVGVTPYRFQVYRPGTVIHINGRDIQAGERGLKVARKWRLNEITITPLGLDKTTSVSIAASETKSNPSAIAAGDTSENAGVVMAAQAEEIQEVQAAGEVPTQQLAKNFDINAAVEAGIANRLPSLVESAVTKATESIQAQFTERETRRSELQGLLGNGEILATAMAEGWSNEKAELHRLRGTLPKSPLASLSSNEGAPKQNEVIEASLMIGAGGDGESLKRFYSDDTIEAAMSGGMRGYGLHALCYDTMQRAGHGYTPGIFTDDTIRAAFEADREIRASGQSLYSLTGVTSNIANKFLLQGFNSVEQAWRSIAATGSVSDFKQQTFFRLGADATYKKLGKGAAIESGSMDEESYTNQADTVARMFAIDRKTLVNDDLNAIRQAARIRLGVGAGLALAEIIWGRFHEATADGFFSTSHADAGANLKTGAGSALSIDTLTEAEQMFMLQHDKQGDPLPVDPQILLVPPQLSVPANSFVKDTEVRQIDTNANKKSTYTTANPHAGKFRVVVSRYLSLPKVANSSATAWYLLADPTALDIGALQVVFLNGRQTPTIETADADFKTLGIQMRGYHDFGVNLMEKRTAVRFAGA